MGTAPAGVVHSALRATFTDDRDHGEGDVGGSDKDIGSGPEDAFEVFLTRRRQQGDPQSGLIILDKTTRETSLQKLSREFRKVGTRWGSLNNIADTPFFVDSRASPFLTVGTCQKHTRQPEARGC